MTSRNIRKFVIIFLALSFTQGLAFAGKSLTVRPQIGYGYSDSKTLNRGSIYHVGIRILLDAGETKRYGLEVSRFNRSDGDNYTSSGIILEQRLWGWFNMSIGTIGYFGYGLNSNNVIGLTTNLGWEPVSNGTLKPFVTYRNDVIFSRETDISHSVSLGLAFDF